MTDQLFIGQFPTGLAYCDRTIEEDGDYKRVAFLPCDSPELEIHDASSSLLPRARLHAAKVVSTRDPLMALRAIVNEANFLTTDGATELGQRLLEIERIACDALKANKS